MRRVCLFPGPVLVWVTVLVTIVLWAVTLWLLLRLWARMARVRRLSLASSIFYAWGLLLDEPYRTPAGSSGKAGANTDT